ncbi:hypothetical protein H9P43_000944 [Blastocladiella emersonii ATCC 22665]|nr:hypothetical protein H9P43_000944 [Blastocladiella emersonii ATCC 22665]
MAPGPPAPGLPPPPPPGPPPSAAADHHPPASASWSSSAGPTSGSTDGPPSRSAHHGHHAFYHPPPPQTHHAHGHGHGHHHAHGPGSSGSTHHALSPRTAPPAPIGERVHGPLLATVLNTARQLAGHATPNEFMGTRPAALEANNIGLLEQDDYYVREKPNGLRALLLFDRPSKAVYMIDRRASVFKIEMSFPTPQGDPHHETLIDGELVLERVPGRHRFLCTDLLALHGKTDIATKSLDRRLGFMNAEVIKPHARQLQSTPGLVPQFVLDLGRVERSYGFAKVLDTIIPHLRYPCNGLVFTPVHAPYVSGPCSKVLKWRPPELYTALLLIRTRRAAGTGVPRYVALVAQDSAPTDPQLHEIDDISPPDDLAAAWEADPPQDRVGEFAWDERHRTQLVGRSSSSDAPGSSSDAPGSEPRRGGWRFVRWRDDASVPSSAASVQAGRYLLINGIRESELRARGDAIRTAWKARKEAAKDNHQVARSASSDNLLSPSASAGHLPAARRTSHSGPFPDHLPPHEPSAGPPPASGIRRRSSSHSLLVSPGQLPSHELVRGNGSANHLLLTAPMRSPGLVASSEMTHSPTRAGTSPTDAPAARPPFARRPDSAGSSSGSLLATLTEDPAEQLPPRAEQLPPRAADSTSAPPASHAGHSGIVKRRRPSAADPAGPLAPLVTSDLATAGPRTAPSQPWSASDSSTTAVSARAPRRTSPPRSASPRTASTVRVDGAEPAAAPSPVAPADAASERSRSRDRPPRAESLAAPSRVPASRSPPRQTRTVPAAATDTTVHSLPPRPRFEPSAPSPRLARLGAAESRPSAEPSSAAATPPSARVAQRVFSPVDEPGLESEGGSEPMDLDGSPGPAVAPVSVVRSPSPLRKALPLPPLPPLPPPPGPISPRVPISRAGSPDRGPTAGTEPGPATVDADLAVDEAMDVDPPSVPDAAAPPPAELAVDSGAAGSSSPDATAIRVKPPVDATAAPVPLAAATVDAAAAVSPKRDAPTRPLDVSATPVPAIVVVAPPSPAPLPAPAGRAGSPPRTSSPLFSPPRTSSPLWSDPPPRTSSPLLSEVPNSPAATAPVVRATSRTPPPPSPRASVAPAADAPSAVSPAASGSPTSALAVPASTVAGPSPVSGAPAPAAVESATVEPAPAPPPAAPAQSPPPPAVAPPAAPAPAVPTSSSATLATAPAPAVGVGLDVPASALEPVMTAVKPKRKLAASAAAAPLSSTTTTTATAKPKAPRKRRKTDDDALPSVPGSAASSEPTTPVPGPLLEPAVEKKGRRASRARALSSAAAATLSARAASSAANALASNGTGSTATSAAPSPQVASPAVVAGSPAVGPVLSRRASAAPRPIRPVPDATVEMQQQQSYYQAYQPQQQYAYQAPSAAAVSSVAPTPLLAHGHTAHPAHYAPVAVPASQVSLLGAAATAPVHLARAAPPPPMPPKMSISFLLNDSESSGGRSPSLSPPRPQQQQQHPPAHSSSAPSPVVGPQFHQPYPAASRSRAASGSASSGLPPAAPSSNGRGHMNDVDVAMLLTQLQAPPPAATPAAVAAVPVKQRRPSAPQQYRAPPAPMSAPAPEFTYPPAQGAQPFSPPQQYAAHATAHPVSVPPPPNAAAEQGHAIAPAHIVYGERRVSTMDTHAAAPVPAPAHHHHASAYYPQQQPLFPNHTAAPTHNIYRAPSTEQLMPPPPPPPPLYASQGSLGPSPPPQEHHHHHYHHVQVHVQGQGQGRGPAGRPRLHSAPAPPPQGLVDPHVAAAAYYGHHHPPPPHPHLLHQQQYYAPPPPQPHAQPQSRPSSSGQPGGGDSTSGGGGEWSAYN